MVFHDWTKSIWNLVGLVIRKIQGQSSIFRISRPFFTHTESVLESVIVLNHSYTVKGLILNNLKGLSIRNLTGYILFPLLRSRYPDKSNQGQSG